MHQHELLVDHADAKGDRIPRTINLHTPAVDKNLARVGTVKSIEDLHQGAFARAILTQQRVNFACLKREIDAVIGEHVGEALDDASHLDGGFCRQHDAIEGISSGRASCGND